MRRLALVAGVLLGIGAPVGAYPIVQYVQLSTTGPKQSGGFNVGKSTVTQLCFDDLTCQSSASGGTAGLVQLAPAAQQTSAFKLSSGTVNLLNVSGSARVANLTGFPSQCLQSDTNGLISGTGVACGSGSGGITVYPATATANFPYGMQVSTIQVSTITLQYSILNQNTGNRIFGVSGTAGTNLYVGENAGILSGSGIGNTGLGYSVMTNLTTGATNTGSGVSALQSITTGSSNTGHGGNSLFSVTTGRGNVGVGYDSGYDHNTANGIVSGSSNTFLGANAGTTNSAINHAMAIGADTVVTASNTVVMGGSPGTFSTVNLIVSSVTVAGLTAGQCVQAGTGGLLTVSGSACGSGSGGSSSLQVTQSGVQVTSPTASENFYGGDFILTAIGSTSTIALNPATTDFIHAQSSLQSGATFYVSSGTVNTAFITNGTVVMKTPITVDQPSFGVVTSAVNLTNTSAGQSSSFGQRYYGGAGFNAPFFITDTLNDGSFTHYGQLWVDPDYGTTVIAGSNSVRAFSVGKTLGTTPYNFVVSTMGAVLMGGDAGTSGYVLTSAGSNAVPTWSVASGGGGGSSTTTVQINGVTLSAITTNFNMIAGTGMLITGSTPTANNVNLTYAADTAVMLTRATGQANTDNICYSSNANTTYACSLATTLTQYTTGMCLTLIVSSSNLTTSTATLNVDTRGAKSILAFNGAALSTGSINTGDPVTVCLSSPSSTGWIIQGGNGSSSGGGGSTSPGGSTTQLQYNNAGSFGGTPLATVDASSISFNAISSMTFVNFSSFTFGSGTGIDITAGTLYASTMTFNNGALLEANGTGLTAVSSMSVSGSFNSVGNTIIGGLAAQVFIPNLGTGGSGASRFVTISTIIAGNPLSAQGLVSSDLPTGVAFLQSTQTFSAAQTFSSTITVVSIIGTGVPAISTGTGAGTVGSPTATISGKNMWGQITLNSATTPATTATIATVTPSVAMPTKWVCILFPANATTALLSGVSMVTVDGTATTWTITSGSSGLTGSSTYLWDYSCGGY